MMKKFINILLSLMIFNEVNGNHTLRSYNNRFIKIEDVPYMMYLKVKTLGGESFICSGVLIHPSWVLTTRSCCTPEKTKSILVHMGVRDATVDIAISSIYARYMVEPKGKTGIILLRLTKVAKLSEKINIIKLENKKWEKGYKDCLSVGYGHSVNSSHILSGGNYRTTYGLESCGCRCPDCCASGEGNTDVKPEPQTICATHANESACRADSGAALVCDNKLVGILKDYYNCYDNQINKDKCKMAGNVNRYFYLCYFLEFIYDYVRMGIPRHCKENFKIFEDQKLQRSSASLQPITIKILYTFVIFLYVQIFL